MEAPVFVWRDTYHWLSGDRLAFSSVPENCPWCGNQLVEHRLSDATTWDYYEYVSWCENFCGWYIHHDDFNLISRSGELRHFDINSSELELSEVGTHLQKQFSDIYNLSWKKFEDLIADVFRSAKFYPVLTQRTRDNGADILLYRHDKEDLMAIVECKKYAADRKVGVGTVQRLVGASVDWKVRSAYLVTSGNFTTVARDKVMDFQKRGYEIELAGVSELFTLLGIYNDVLPPLHKISKEKLREVVQSEEAVEVPNLQERNVSQNSTSDTPLPSLEGSTWSGEDLPGTAPFGEILHVIFHEDGKLSFTDRGILKIRMGTWKQIGTRVMFETFNYYTVYQGSVAGTRMEGVTQNKKGWRWKWYLSLDS